MVSRLLGYESRVIGGGKVGWLLREPGPSSSFSVYDEDAQLIGRCKHVIIATARPPCCIPGVYGQAREQIPA